MVKARISSLVLIIIIAMFSTPHPISANVPPPLSLLGTDSGGLYTTASNVSMPYAEVNATIDLSGSWNYDVSVSCTFYVLSLITQNLTTAFVYPSVWVQWDEVPNIMMKDFHIDVNGSLVNHTVLNYDEFKSRYDANQTDWERVDDCDFASFNLSIDAGEPIFIDVIAEFSTTASGHSYAFDYIVDTARGWEGDTREIVKIDFNRGLETEIIQYGFYPNESVSWSGNNYTATVTWDFHISLFEHSRVTFIIQQQETPEYRGNPPPDPYFWVPAAMLATVVLLVVVGLRKAGRI